MKKYFYLATLALGMMFATTACSDDDETAQSPTDLDCTSENLNSWKNYMRVVANLLVTDATNLYNDWNTSYNGGVSYAEQFTTQRTGQWAVTQLLDGCIDIADEVGGAKIGDPLALYQSGQTEKALYAVESWYSWHSREDYRNNIYSIRNTYYGTRDITGEPTANSLAVAVAAVNPTLDSEVKAAIKKAADAIWAIPQPFRNNINSNEAKAAMEACDELSEKLQDLKAYVNGETNPVSETQLKAIASYYVSAVVLPTYLDLKTKNETLQATVEAFWNNPSDAAFSKCADAWLVAREPWERSEAFLFGPVADRGLDPNMDSWPLDQEGIVQVLTSGNYDYLNWDGDYDEEDDNIASKQALRGFHTLEYLVFKDGVARTIK